MDSDIRFSYRLLAVGFGLYRLGYGLTVGSCIYEMKTAMTERVSSLQGRSTKQGIYIVKEVAEHRKQ